MTLPPMAILFLRRWYRFETAQQEHRSFPIRMSFQDYKLKPKDMVKHPVFQEMVDAGFLIASAEPECHGTHRLNLDSEALAVICDRHVLSILSTEVDFGSRSINEFASYILLNGSVEDTYETWRLLDSSFAHVCLCGVDWKNSRGPEDDTWSEFNDTYTPNSERPMVSVRLACKCGKVGGGNYSKRLLSDAVVGIEPLSTIELIRMVSDGFLKD